MSFSCCLKHLEHDLITMVLGRQRLISVVIGDSFNEIKFTCNWERNSAIVVLRIRFLLLNNFVFRVLRGTKIKSGIRWVFEEMTDFLDTKTRIYLYCFLKGTSWSQISVCCQEPFGQKDEQIWCSPFLLGLISFCFILLASSDPLYSSGLWLDKVN